MNIICIVQARMGSTRLPGKIIKKIGGKPIILLILERLSKSKFITKTVVATTESSKNDCIEELIIGSGNLIFRGSEENVLDRYFQAALKFKADVVVRITGDCPFIDHEIVDQVISEYLNRGVDYCRTSEECYPDGLDTEVFSFNALKMAKELATKKYDLEHVTPFIRNSKEFTRYIVTFPELHGDKRWTVDDPEDLEMAIRVAEKFAPRLDFSWKEVVSLEKSNPEIFLINKNILRNEGALIGTGQKLWKRATKIIPGGNMLLSKRAEMFLPKQWPSYFSKAKGCRVWDMDGNEYIDMCIMGIGTNTLGYGHPEIDDAVKKTVDLGNMSTLNCPEEVYLAEKLVEMHPWADMVRLARSGGEANAIAIRIARAATRKDKVAICGYHGWHDWYLSANLNDEKGLDGHLLPGLNPLGVPRNLKGTIFPFTYNKINELEALVASHDIGVIKMEVSRNKGPENNFLHEVRKIATQKGIVLIFDECTSGFRETFGGLHKKYKIEPDMAMFGKALGNGYAITAIIGKREFMESAQSTFISSTFWTERIGPTAALKTIEVMEREKSWEKITNIGLKIQENWQRLADKYGLSISHWGLPALAGFTFNYTNCNSYKTLITQEMLNKGYLAGNSVYACLDHTDEVIDGYFQNLEPIFKTIRDCEDGLDIKTLLKGPVCHQGFKRLN